MPGVKNSQDSSGDWIEALRRVMLPGHQNLYGQAPVDRYSGATMRNNLNYSYFGEVYLGSDLQKLLVIWDTGSGNFLVRSSMCTNCNSNREYEPWFDIETTESIVVTDVEDSTTYISGDTLAGVQVFDDVCPIADINTCARGFRFVAI